MRIGWIACKQPELYAKLLAFKSTMDPVSYTHLDVYKRQDDDRENGQRRL